MNIIDVHVDIFFPKKFRVDLMFFHTDIVSLASTRTSTLKQMLDLKPPAQLHKIKSITLSTRRQLYILNFAINSNV